MGGPNKNLKILGSIFAPIRAPIGLVLGFRRKTLLKINLTLSTHFILGVPNMDTCCSLPSCSTWAYQRILLLKRSKSGEYTSTMPSEVVTLEYSSNMYVDMFMVSLSSSSSSSGKGNLQIIKNSTFSTKFFANFHYFCVLFLSSRQKSTKPQHFTMCHYSAKQHSGIIYYILQQSHVMHQLVLLNFHIIIVVTHETIDGQLRC